MSQNASDPSCQRNRQVNSGRVLCAYRYSSSGRLSATFTFSKRIVYGLWTKRLFRPVSGWVRTTGCTDSYISRPSYPAFTFKCAPLVAVPKTGVRIDGTHAGQHVPHPIGQSLEGKILIGKHRIAAELGAFDHIQQRAQCGTRQKTLVAMPEIADNPGALWLLHNLDNLWMTVQ